MVMVANFVVVVVKACVGDVEEIGDLSLKSVEEEEVFTVDGVFKGAFGALGDKTWFGGGSFGGCDRDNGG
nr:hypothetical protein [Tanacetum cinerariifolium]